MARPFAALLRCLRPLGCRVRRRCGSVECAANWPSKPIRAIVPIAPGTGGDVDGRGWCSISSRNRLGQQIVIENRGGAGGTHRRRRGQPRPIRTATRSSRIPRRTPSRRRSIRTCRYDVTQRFRRRRADRQRCRARSSFRRRRASRRSQQFVAEAKAKPETASPIASAGVGSTTHLTAGAIPAERGDYRRCMCRSAAAASARGGIAGRVDFALSRRSRWRCRTCKDGRLLALAVSRPQTARRRCPTCRPRSRPATRIPTMCSGSAVRAGEDAARHRRPAARREHQGAAESPALRERLAGLDVDADGR